MSTGTPGLGTVARLELLAAELQARGHQANVLTPADQQPYLHAANPGILSENVACEAGWYWWPWADRIAPVTEVSAAADTIVRVLRADGQPG